ncbi:hypothetical protein C0Q70_15574 [Pomacea canaliculata]|uniref:Uncharacterized protein n=1 Tax=Pomacea canaliculata TaxID=400727 RepID=A0A2T7NVA2_POMCA|nr:hypothetical protein C0Q70_15574 [Pomacea canaliculata]
MGRLQSLQVVTSMLRSANKRRGTGGRGYGPHKTGLKTRGCLQGCLLRPLGTSSASTVRLLPLTASRHDWPSAGIHARALPREGDLTRDYTTDVPSPSLSTHPFPLSKPSISP